MGRAVSWDETGRQNLVPRRQFVAARIQNSKGTAFCQTGKISHQVAGSRVLLLGWARNSDRAAESQDCASLLGGQEDPQMAPKFTDARPHFPREMQITNTGHQLTPTGTLGARKTVNRCWRGQGRNWNATLLEGVKNRAALVENSCVFLKG